MIQTYCEPKMDENSNFIEDGRYILRRLVNLRDEIRRSAHRISKMLLHTITEEQSFDDVTNSCSRYKRIEDLHLHRNKTYGQLEDKAIENKMIIDSDEMENLVEDMDYEDPRKILTEITKSNR